MARFKQLNQYVSDILTVLLENQNLCKLLYYPNNDPFSEPDIEDTSSLILDKIHFLPKLPDEKLPASSFLAIYLDNFTTSRDNYGVKEGLLVFEVITHNDLWVLKGTGKLRPYSILHEIDNMLNHQNIVGIKKILFDRIRFLYVNSAYSGYQVTYSIVSGN